MATDVTRAYWNVSKRLIALAGRDYFRALAGELVSTLGVRYALTTVRTGPEAARLRTLAFAPHGRLPEGFEYDLAGTPCEPVIAGSELALVDGLERRFPDCAAVAQLGARAFAGVPLKGRSGRAIGHLSVLHDAPLPAAKALLPLLRRLAAHAAAELERSRAEDRFGQIAEAVPQVFWMEDYATGRLLYVSPAFERIWGRPVEELYRQPRAWLDTVHPEDRAAVVETALAARRRGRRYEVQYRILRRDGEVRVIDDRVFLMRPSGRRVTALCGVAADITERARAREELETSRSLYTLGRLSSGLAHDFNNVLTVLAMSVERLGEDAPRSAPVAAARRALARGKDLTRHLSAFGRRRPGGSLRADMNAAVGEALSLVRGLFPAGAGFHLSLGRGLPPVAMERAKLELIVMNLLMSVRDAAPGGAADVRIETRRAAVPGAGRRPGVALSILDASPRGERPGVHLEPVAPQVVETGGSVSVRRAGNVSGVVVHLPAR